MRSSLVAFTVSLALLCLAAPAQAAGISYGVMPQTGLQPRDFIRMDGAGVDVVRIMLSRHASGFAKTDAIVAAAAKRRIRVLPYLVGVNAKGGRRELEEWSAFAAEAAARYGHQGSFWAERAGLRRLPVETWQILNEQNSRSFFGSRPSPRAYARLLQAASKAISGEDRRARIVLGGMAELKGVNGVRPGSRYLRDLYRIPGIERWFDAVAVHPYAARVSGVIAQVEGFRDQMRRARDGASELWVTEIGWSSAANGNPLNVGAVGQAERLREAFEYLRSSERTLGLDGIIWYSWRDSRASLCEWCKHSGLLSAAGTRKRALREFKRVAG